MLRPPPADLQLSMCPGAVSKVNSFKLIVFTGRLLGCLGYGDIGEALHGLVESRLLLVIDELNAGVEDVRVSLNLLHDVQQTAGHLVVSLHVIHSHVVNVLVSWCDDLNDAVTEGVADQRDNAR